MGNSSRLFYILVGVLALLIMGLSGAIYSQRQAAAQAETLQRLEADVQRLALVTERADAIVRQLPDLKLSRDAAAEQSKKTEGRVYKADNRTAFEALVSQVASAGRFDVTKIDSAGVQDSGPFREMTFTVQMLGPISGVSAWTEALFRQRMIILVDGISVTSPDSQLQRARVKATVRVFEPKPIDTILGTPFAPATLDIPLDYLQDKNPEDSVYGTAMKDAQQKAEHLNGLKATVVEAAKVESELAGYTAIAEGIKKLEEQTKVNRKQILDNLSTLFSRLQKSQVGSAALLIQGGNVRFPEVTPDE